MRTSWRNLDWLGEDDRARIEARLQALGGNADAVDRVDFLGASEESDDGSFEARALGKIGKSQITAIRSGNSAEKAFEAVLSAFEESALWVIESSDPKARVTVAPIDPVVEEVYPEPQVWDSEEVAPAAIRASGSLRGSRRDRLAAFRERTRQTLGGLSLNSVRRPLPTLPSLRWPRPSLPQLRLPWGSLPSIELPRISMPRIPLDAVARLRGASRGLRKASPSALRVPAWSGVRVGLLDASRATAEVTRLRARDLQDLGLYAIRGVRSWGWPVTAAVGGFLVIGISSFQGESFTGKTLPPEVRAGEMAVFSATARLVDVSAAGIQGASPEATSDPLDLPSAFSAVATPDLLLDLSSELKLRDPSDDLPSVSMDRGAESSAFSATASQDLAGRAYPAIRSLGGRLEASAYSAMATSEPDFSAFVAFSNDG